MQVMLLPIQFCRLTPKLLGQSLFLPIRLITSSSYSLVKVLVLPFCYSFILLQFVHCILLFVNIHSVY